MDGKDADWEYTQKPPDNTWQYALAIIIIVAVVLASYYIIVYKDLDDVDDDQDVGLPNLYTMEYYGYEADDVVTLSVGENYTFRDEDVLYLYHLVENETRLENSIDMNYTIEGDYGYYVWMNCTFTALNIDYSGDLFASFRTNIGIEPENWWTDEDYIYRIKFVVEEG